MLLGGALAVLFFARPRSTASLVVGVASIILLVGSLLGWSLFYFVLRRSTRSDKDAKPVDHS
jgi:hypothetical protein